MAPSFLRAIEIFDICVNTCGINNFQYLARVISSRRLGLLVLLVVFFAGSGLESRTLGLFRVAKGLFGFRRPQFLATGVCPLSAARCLLPSESGLGPCTRGKNPCMLMGLEGWEIVLKRCVSLYSSVVCELAYQKNLERNSQFRLFCGRNSRLKLVFHANCSCVGIFWSI